MTEESNAIRERLAAISEQEGYRAEFRTAMHCLGAEEIFLRKGSTSAAPQNDAAEEDAEFTAFDAAALEEIEKEIADFLQSRESLQQTKAEYLEVLESSYFSAKEDGRYDDAKEYVSKIVDVKSSLNYEELSKMTEEERKAFYWQEVFSSFSNESADYERSVTWAKHAACERLGLEEELTALPREKETLPKESYRVIDYPGRTTALLPPKTPKKQEASSVAPTVLLFLALAAFTALAIRLFVSVASLAGLFGLIPVIFFLVKACSSASADVQSRREVARNYALDLKHYAEEQKKYERDLAAQAEGKEKQRQANAETDERNREIQKQNEEIERYNKAVLPEKVRDYFRVLKAARKALWEELQKLQDILEENYRDFLPEKCRDKKSVDGLLDIFDYGRAETLPEALRLLYDDRMMQQAETP